MEKPGQARRQSRDKRDSKARTSETAKPRQARRQSRDKDETANRVYCSASKMDDKPSYWSNSRRLGTVHFAAPFTLFLYIASHPFFVLLSNLLSTSTRILHFGRLFNLPHTPKLLQRVYCYCSTAALLKVCDRGYIEYTGSLFLASSSAVQQIDHCVECRRW